MIGSELAQESFEFARVELVVVYKSPWGATKKLEMNPSALYVAPGACLNLRQKMPTSRVVSRFKNWQV